MPTVIDDDTGEEVEVKPVHATATVASVNSLHSDFPKGSAQFIEKHMAAAVMRAHEEGVTDPEEIRERILVARQLARNAIATAVQEHNSRIAAGEQE